MDISILNMVNVFGKNLWNYLISNFIEDYENKSKVQQLQIKEQFHSAFLSILEDFSNADLNRIESKDLEYVMSYNGDLNDVLNDPDNELSAVIYDIIWEELELIE